MPKKYIVRRIRKRESLNSASDAVSIWRPNAGGRVAILLKADAVDQAGPMLRLPRLSGYV
jgi:hypothetical protein